jgi:hypothetical protein
LIDETSRQRYQIGPRQSLGHQAADQLVAARPASPATETELLIDCHKARTYPMNRTQAGSLGKRGLWVKGECGQIRDTNGKENQEH